VQKKEETLYTLDSCDTYEIPVPYESPLHLIEHHSFEHQGGVEVRGGFVLQPPALLPEESRQSQTRRLKRLKHQRYL